MTSDAATKRPLWQKLQEAAHAAEISAAQCMDDIDFDSAAYYRGRASAFRDASVLASAIPGEVKP